MIAKGVADGDVWAYEKAARLFDVMLPSDALIVPMPSHLGEPMQMLAVAERLVDIRGTGRILIPGLLRQAKGPGARWQKEQGLFPDVKMYIAERYAFGGKDVFIIDNVVCTGATAEAASVAVRSCPGIGRVTVCAIAYSQWRRF